MMLAPPMIKPPFVEPVLWRIIRRKGNKKSTRRICLMLSRPSMTEYSIAKDIGDMKVTIWGHPGTYLLKRGVKIFKKF